MTVGIICMDIVASGVRFDKRVDDVCVIGLK